MKLTSYESECIDKTHEHIRELFRGQDPSHDFYHVLRVVNNAKLLLSSESGDYFTVIMAAYLHDSKDRKLFGTDAQQNIMEFLEEIGLPSKQIKLLIDIITSISFSSESRFTCPELQVVQDADRLDAIGALGIARAFSYGAFRKTPFFDKDILVRHNMTKEEYKKYQGTTINHFHEKLLLLKDLMNTKTAKDIAQKRHDFMLTFLEQFDREVSWPSI